jgi:hypothetical protein
VRRDLRQVARERILVHRPPSGSAVGCLTIGSPSYALCGSTHNFNCRNPGSRQAEAYWRCPFILLGMKVLGVILSGWQRRQTEERYPCQL